MGLLPFLAQAFGLNAQVHLSLNISGERQIPSP